MIRKLFILSLAFGIIYNVGGQSEHQFSLGQCIDYALEHNKDLLNAALDKQIAQKQVNETIADGLPQINGSLDLGYNYKVPTTQLPAVLIPEEFRDASTPADGFVPVDFSTKYNGTALINLEQMVFNGSYFVGLQAAKTYTELSRKDHIKTKIDVVEAVSKAYYMVLVNKERMNLVRTNYKRLDTLLRDTRIMNENGFAERIEVNRIKVQFNNIKVERDNIEKTLALSRAMLKFQMGMPQNEGISLTDDISAIDFQFVESVVKDSSFRYEQRIEYSQLQTNKDLAELEIKNTKVQYLPRVDIYAALGASAGTQERDELLSFGKDPWFGQGVVGVKLNLPIFDGFRKSNIIQQKKLQTEQIENNFENLRNSIDLEITQSSINYDKAVDNMAAQQENMELAEEVYNVSKIKYEEGVGSSIEVTDADADFKEAQTNYYNALYDALIAKVELEKAYGKLLGTY